MSAQLKLESFVGESQAEKRATRRERVLLAAKVAFGATTADCTVRDLSDAGAKIHAPSVLGLPEEVHLLIFSEGRILRARRVWASFPFFGLKFIGTEQVEESTRPQTAALRKSWDEWARSQSR